MGFFSKSKFFYTANFMLIPTLFYVVEVRRHYSALFQEESMPIYVKKIADIEEELRVVGQNLQTLEVGEEKTIQREEKYQTEIMDLRLKLKASEYRGEQAEMNIQRLNVRIDAVEEDLLAEKMKIKKSSDELNQVFDDMLNLKC